MASWKGAPRCRCRGGAEADTETDAGTHTKVDARVDAGSEARGEAEAKAEADADEETGLRVDYGLRDLTSSKVSKIMERLFCVPRRDIDVSHFWLNGDSEDICAPETDPLADVGSIFFAVGDVIVTV